jgi:nitrite reductase/ring-hydroxylating ferredoxin subunit
MKQTLKPLAECKDIPNNSSISVNIYNDGDFILYRNENGEFMLSSSLCPHQNEPLDHGHFQDSQVICRRHHLIFDLKTGECLNACGYSLQTLPVVIRDGVICALYWED